MVRSIGRIPVWNIDARITLSVGFSFGALSYSTACTKTGRKIDIQTERPSVKYTGQISLRVRYYKGLNKDSFYNATI